MRSPRLLIAPLAAAFLSLAVAPAASANTFTMSSCTLAQGLPHPWISETTAGMYASRGCDHGEGLGVWGAVVNGVQPPVGSYARWRLGVPGALEVRGIRGEILLKQGSGWSSGIHDDDRGIWLYGGPSCIAQCGNGVFTVFDFGADSHNISLVMSCWLATCTPGPMSAIRNLEVTIDDPTPPRLRLTGGTLLNDWVRGDGDISYHAADDSGVQRTEIFLDGQQKEAHDHGCQTLRLPICEATLEGTASLSTRLFAGDGPHTVTIRATDFSGNVTDVPIRVRADNTAPIAPLGLANASSQWQSANRFALGWTNPPQPSGAPIAGASWRLCPAESATGGCVLGRRDGANLTEVADLSVPGPGLWRLELALIDAAGNTDLANATNLTLGFDDTPPEIAIAPTDPQDPTRLRINATDGVSPIVRGDVELRRRGSRVWRSVPAQLTTAGVEAVIDDEILAAGDYDVRAHAWNAAGLERSSETWTTGQRALLTLPLRIATRVRLGKASRRAGRPRGRAVLVRRPVLAYGRRVRLTGQLTAPGGNPLVDVPVQVTTRINRPNAAWRPAAELRTDRSGHFRYIVARGPSRLVRFHYPGTPTIRSLTRDVAVRVRASTSITVSRHNVINGDAVRFRGKLRGGHLPARKRVELQFHARGKWRTFASTRTKRRGRWGYTYRFDGSRGTVRWRFRALITPEAGYPYTTGRSRRVAVTVRGLP